MEKNNLITAENWEEMKSLLSKYDGEIVAIQDVNGVISIHKDNYTEDNIGYETNGNRAFYVETPTGKFYWGILNYKEK